MILGELFEFSVEANYFSSFQMQIRNDDFQNQLLFLGSVDEIKKMKNLNSFYINLSLTCFSLQLN